MMLKKYSEFKIVCLVSLLVAGSGVFAAGSQERVKVHLPRTIQVDSDIVTLADIAVVTGNSEISREAGKIVMGKFSSAEQNIVIDRKTILSRLASNNIRNKDVILSGAEQVRVNMENLVITSDALLEKAKKFLKDKNPDSSVSGYEPANTPRKIVTDAAGTDKIEIIPSLVTDNNNYHRRVKLTVMKGEEKISERRVSFRLKFSRKAAVATENIPLGTEITSENTEIRKIVSGSPPRRKFSEPYGLTARRHIPADTVIKSYMVGEVQPELVIKRNQTVSIKVERPGMLITTTGKAMQNGHQGELIKVKNISSQRIIYACVNEDGSVSPAY